LQFQNNGLEVSYNSNIFYFISEVLVIILSLISNALLEKKEINNKWKSVISSIVLAFISIITLLIIYFFFFPSLYLLGVVFLSIFVKIISSYNNYTQFKINLAKSSVALIYSIFFVIFFSIGMVSYSFNYMELIPLTWALLYTIYIGYLLPFRHHDLQIDE